VQVTLREVTAETVRAVCDLTVGPGQGGLVAPNAVSIAQAHFEPKAWFRAIYAGDDPVGFVMLYDDVPECFLWRLMVDHRHQGRGYGRRAIDLVVERLRERPGVTALLTSYVPTPSGPERFYKRYGFIDTGEVDGGEVVCRLTLG
jgi:diamine N-acetyltransferase